MIYPIGNRRLISLCVAALFSGLTFAGALFTAAPVAARVFIGVGVGVPGFYYGPPYPYYPYPYPYYYPPPAYYPPPEPYPPASEPPASYQPPGTPPADSSFSYTNRPGWTDAAGEPCREYKSTQMVGGKPSEVYGTACRDATGTWRIVN